MRWQIVYATSRSLLLGPDLNTGSYPATEPLLRDRLALVRTFAIHGEHPGRRITQVSWIIMFPSNITIDFQRWVDQVFIAILRT